MNAEERALGSDLIRSAFGSSLRRKVRRTNEDGNASFVIHFTSKGLKVNIGLLRDDRNATYHESNSIKY